VDRLLKSITVFAGLDDKARALFLDHAKKLAVPAEAVIAREGETNHCMFLIGSGSVRIVKNFRGSDETILTVLRAGDFFGEMCVLEPMPRAATAQACEPSIVFQVPSSAFHQLYDEMPAQFGLLMLNIARDLSRRLRRLDEIFAARH